MKPNYPFRENIKYLHNQSTPK